MRDYPWLRYTIDKKHIIRAGLCNGICPFHAFAVPAYGNHTVRNV